MHLRFTKSTKPREETKLRDGERSHTSRRVAAGTSDAVVWPRGDTRDARARTPAVTPRRRAPEGAGSIANPSGRCPSPASAPTRATRRRTREARRMRVPRDARGQACSPSGGRWTSPGGRSARGPEGARCTPTAGAPRAAAEAKAPPRRRCDVRRLATTTTARGVPGARDPAFPPARGRARASAR